MCSPVFTLILYYIATRLATEFLHTKRNIQESAVIINNSYYYSYETKRYFAKITKQDKRGFGKKNSPHRQAHLEQLMEDTVPFIPFEDEEEQLQQQQPPQKSST